MTEHWPAWRTSPVDFGVVGYRPFLVGGVAAMAVPPLLGIVLAFLSGSTDGQKPNVPFEVGFIIRVLIESYSLTWMAVIVAAPISAFCVHIGWAGWAVFLLVGAAVGLIGEIPLSSAVGSQFSFALPVLGALFATTYWLAIRLAYPAVFGIFRKVTS